MSLGLEQTKQTNEPVFFSCCASRVVPGAIVTKPSLSVRARHRTVIPSDSTSSTVLAVVNFSNQALRVRKVAFAGFAHTHLRCGRLNRKKDKLFTTSTSQRRESERERENRIMGSTDYDQVSVDMWTHPSTLIFACCC